MHILKGIIKVVIGLAMMIGAIPAEIAWLVLCFGTVVIGVILIFTFPLVLIAPFTFLWFPGWQLIKSGFLDIEDPNRNFPDHILDGSSAVSSIVWPQLIAITRNRGHCAIDTTTLAYITSLVKAKAHKQPSLIDSRDILWHLLFQCDYLVANSSALEIAYRNAKKNYKSYKEEVSDLEYLAMLEAGAGRGNFLVDHCSQNTTAAEAVT